jgi:pimeloyl-ACP methyl ester carboxylesterase
MTALTQPPADKLMPAEPTPTLYTMRDGVRVAVRHWPRREDDGAKRRPVVCLPGLTRNSRDFTVMARALSRHTRTPRDVYAFDLRGRGASDHDRDWRNYTVATETLDVLDVMTALNLHGAALFGTSRGGMITMAMAAARPGAIGVAVLNDIGPVLEPEGLQRIMSYVGKVPLPETWAAATQSVKDLNARFFPNVSDPEWVEVARQFYNEKDGRPAPGYDSGIGTSLVESVRAAAAGPKTDPWPSYEALGGVPVMIVRGALSDLLSAATLEEMLRRHPRAHALTVEGEGHAPLLRDTATIAAIADFLAHHDVGAH